MSANNVESFEVAFKNLLGFLSHALRGAGHVSFPEELTKPFHQLTNATDTQLLKPLIPLFCGKSKDNGFRLMPRSFYILFVIILHFPYSRIQERLLYGLLNTFAVYRDESATAKKLSKLNGSSIGEAKIRDGRQFICQKIVHHASPILRNSHKGDNAKQLVAQIIAKMLAVDDETARVFLTEQNSQHVRDVICNSANHTLRILIADLARELTHRNHVGFETLFLACPEKLTKATFSSSKATSRWIGAVVEELAQIDFGDPKHDEDDPVFHLRSLEFEDGMYDDQSGNILAIVSSLLTFILPAEACDTLSIIEVPIVKDAFAKSVESTESESIVKIAFSAGDGDRYFQGTKKAINDFRVTLAQPGKVDEFTRAVNLSSKHASSEKQDNTSATDSSPHPPDQRQSMMIATMDWDSDDPWLQKTHIHSESEATSSSTNTRHSMPNEQSPNTVRSIVELEERRTKEAFHNFSGTAQGTNLYEKLKSSQHQHTPQGQCASKTPRLSVGEEHINALNTHEHESPTLRLSQALQGAVSSEEVTIKKRTQSRTDHASDKIKDKRAATSSEYMARAQLTGKSHQIVTSEKFKVHQPLPVADKTLKSSLVDPLKAPTKSKALSNQIVSLQPTGSKKLSRLPPAKRQTIAKSTRAAKRADTDWNKDLRVDTDGEESSQPRRGKKKDTVATKPQPTVSNTLRPPKKTISKAQTIKKQAATAVVKEIEADVVGERTTTSARTPQRMTTTAKSHGDVTGGVDEGEAGNIDDDSPTDIQPDYVVNTAEGFQPQTPKRRNNGNHVNQPITVSSTSMHSMSDSALFEPPVKHAQHAQSAEISQRQSQRFVEQPATSPLLSLQSEETSATENIDKDDGVAAEDSYPLTELQTSTDAAIDASFASKLSQMIMPSNRNSEPSLKAPTTPFGNAKKFVASVNANRSISPRKEAKKNYAKKTPKRKSQAFNLNTDEHDGKQSNTSIVRGIDKQNCEITSVVPQSRGTSATESVGQGVLHREDNTVAQAHDENLLQNTAVVQHVHAVRSAAAGTVQQSPSLRMHIADQDTNQPGTTFFEATETTSRQQSVQDLIPDFDPLQDLPEEAEQTQHPDHNSYIRVLPSERNKVRERALNFTDGETFSGAHETPFITSKKSSTRLKTTPDQNPAQKATKQLFQAPSILDDQPSEKPHVVHFGKNGPLNQGRQVNNSRGRKSFPTKSHSIAASSKTRRSKRYSEPVPHHNKLNIYPQDSDPELEAFDQEEEGFAPLIEEHMVTAATDSPNQAENSEIHLPKLDEVRSFQTNSALSRQNLAPTNPLPQLYTQDLEVDLSRSLIDKTPATEDQRQEGSESEAIEEKRTRSRSRLAYKQVDKYPAELKTQHLVKYSISDTTIPDLGVESTSNNFKENSDIHSGFHRRTQTRDPPDRHTEPTKATDTKMTCTTSMPASVQSSITSQATMPHPQLNSKGLMTTSISRLVLDNTTLVDQMNNITDTNASKLMPPPPRPRGFRERREDPTYHREDGVLDDQESVESPTKRPLKRSAPSDLSALPPPKRSKTMRSKESTIPSQPQIGTPVSFTATISKEWKDIEDRKKSSRETKAYDTVLRHNERTLLNITRTTNDLSASELHHPSIPGLTYDTSLSEPDLEGTPSSRYRLQDITSKNSGSKARTELRKSMSNLTETILFRLTHHEEVLDSQLSFFQTRTRAMTDQIRVNWSKKLQYEREILLRDVRGEQKDLQKATEYLKANKSKLKELTMDQRLTEAITKRKAELLKLLQNIVV